MISPIRVWALRLFALLALGGWCLTILYVDPESAGRTGQMIFYGTLFVGLSGLMAVGLWEMRRFFGGDDRIKWWRSVRQGTLTGLLGTIALALQQWRLLTWWDTALIVAGLLLIELKWQRNERRLSEKE